MDRLTSLKVFARVVDSGGFSAAARRLDMSTTMVSSHVQALEEHLGVRLLNRTTRRVSVTEVGQAYYDRCTQILLDLEEADGMAGALQSAPRGTLRLHTSANVVPLLEPVVVEYLARYAEASVDVSIGEQTMNLVEEGIDLAVRTTEPPDSSLMIRRLAPWRHVLCAAPAYLERHGRPERLDELSGHNCLRYTYYPFGDEWRFTGPDGRPASVHVTGNLRSSSGDMLRLAAVDGRGLFLAPTFIAADDLASGRLVRILPAYRPPEFAINAIYPHRRHLSAKTRAFIDLMAERFEAHRQWLDPDAGP